MSTLKFGFSLVYPDVDLTILIGAQVCQTHSNTAQVPGFPDPKHQGHPSGQAAVPDPYAAPAEAFLSGLLWCLGPGLLTPALHLPSQNGGARLTAEGEGFCEPFRLVMIPF